MIVNSDSKHLYSSNTVSKTVKTEYCSTLILLNYRLSQKLKLLGNSEFNHLTISLTLPLTCGPKLPLDKWGPNKWEFNILNGRQSKTRDIELRISCSDIMLNYRLSQKLKLLGNSEFNHLTISLTNTILPLNMQCIVPLSYIMLVS